MSNFFKYCFCGWPATFKTAKNSRNTYSSKSTPCRYIKSPPVKCNMFIIASVIALLFSCRPFTVARKITFIVIYSFNRIFNGWSFAYMREKYCKTIFPFFTHCYASSSIIFEGIVFLVITPVYHMNPRFIFRCLIHTMGCASNAYGFLFKTPTTFSMIGPKVNRFNNDYVTTKTLTLPTSVSVFSVFNTADYCKAIKGLTSKVFEIMSGHFETLRLRLSDLKKKRKASVSFLLFGNDPIRLFSK